MTTIEFFHDAVCGWSYLLSPRLYDLARRHQINIVLRAFAIQFSEDEIISRFGSLEQAKQELLQHWNRCQSFAEDPERFNVEGMRKADFHYPCGFNATLAAKAAQVLEGQEGHWRFLDAVQNAYFKQNRNIGIRSVLLDIAEALGFHRLEFTLAMNSYDAVTAVNEDNNLAQRLGIHSSPSLFINGSELISHTLLPDQLESLCEQLQL